MSEAGGTVNGTAGQVPLTACEFMVSDLENHVPRESFLLRTNPEVLEALRRWAEDELRSTNGQLDFVLRQALRETGRLPADDKRPKQDSS